MRNAEDDTTDDNTLKKSDRILPGNPTTRPERPQPSVETHTQPVQPPHEVETHTQPVQPPREVERTPSTQRADNQSDNDF